MKRVLATHANLSLDFLLRKFIMEILPFSVESSVSLIPLLHLHHNPADLQHRRSALCLDCTTGEQTATFEALNIVPANKKLS